MGLFGFATQLTKAAIKTAIVPVGIVYDIAKGEPFEKSGDLVIGATRNLDNAINELLDPEDEDDGYDEV